MVERLPESGAVVVVHTVAMRDYVRQMICDLRGRELLARCKIYVVNRARDCDQLLGVRCPVEIDHAFYESDGVSLETRALLRHMIAVIRAALPQVPPE